MSKFQGKEYDWDGDFSFENTDFEVPVRHSIGEVYN